MEVTADVQAQRTNGLVTGDGRTIGGTHGVIHLAPMHRHIGRGGDAKTHAGPTDAQDPHLDPVANHNGFVDTTGYDEHASSTQGISMGHAESAGTT
jgi:hypothetical protein